MQTAKSNVSMIFMFHSLLVDLAGSYLKLGLGALYLNELGTKIKQPLAALFESNYLIRMLTYLGKGQLSNL